MLSGRSKESSEMAAQASLAPLTTHDIPLLEELEFVTRLAFWGAENYRKFLEECPEYFGIKAVLQYDIHFGRLAGFVLSRSLFENLEVLKLGVHPEFHRRGVGTVLMESAYKEGIRRGCRRCFLEVRKSNLGAIQFYERHRFRIAGTRVNYYTDPVEDAWIMERAL